MSYKNEYTARSVIECSTKCIEDLNGDCYSFEFDKKLQRCRVSENLTNHNSYSSVSVSTYEGKMWCPLLYFLSFLIKLTENRNELYRFVKLCIR